MFFFFPLKALELNRVILSTNNNPEYIEFWPVVAPIWEAMGLRPTLALIADETCSIDTSIGDVIRFEPIPGISEALQAQAIRLLIPAYFPTDICLISDIDMIPISRSYFIQGASSCPEEAFLIYRDGATGYEGKLSYPMCYVAAKGEIFGEIFEVYSSSIEEILLRWKDAGLGWNTDEIMLYEYAKAWQKKGGEVVCLGHNVEGRIDRGDWKTDSQDIYFPNYIDCHCPRPYSAHQSTIDAIVKEVYKQLEIEKILIAEED